MISVPLHFHLKHSCSYGRDECCARCHSIGILLIVTATSVAVEVLLVEEIWAPVAIIVKAVAAVIAATTILRAVEVVVKVVFLFIIVDFVFLGNHVKKQKVYILAVSRCQTFVSAGVWILF